MLNNNRIKKIQKLIMMHKNQKDQKTTNRITDNFSDWNHNKIKKKDKNNSKINKNLSLKPQGLNQFNNKMLIFKGLSILCKEAFYKIVEKNYQWKDRKNE